ncbi:unnamed protein product [Leptosia nina]|uniref:Nucleolus and neural progenitor protein-like N-terminal domain-containing protein n=1 Tax=Leptosia nina TaxID=320188 RepID=A0AAV1IXC7_9NEOP
MLEPWNNKEIFPPPINTFLSTNKIDISIMKTTMNNIVQMLLKQSPLHQESAIMSRLLYKFDKKFRNDIGYRNFKKYYQRKRIYLISQPGKC